MKDVYFDDENTYGKKPRKRSHDSNGGLVNYLLKKGIVNTRSGANLILLIAVFAMVGLTSFLWNKDKVSAEYITDEYGKVYHIDDYVKQIEEQSINQRS
jgi:hypothetical protein